LQTPDAPSISFNDFRPAFLEHLGELGAEGLRVFLFTSLQSLIDRGMKKSGKQAVS
jgi:hypothetical protein